MVIWSTRKTAFLFSALVLCFGVLNINYPFNIAGINIKTHELMLIVFSVYGFFCSVKYLGASIFVLCGLLLLYFLYGLFGNALAPVMRDMLQILYMFSLFGFLSVRDRDRQKLDKLLVYALLLASPMAFTIGVANDLDRWDGVGYETQLLYNIRLPLIGLLLMILVQGGRLKEFGLPKVMVFSVVLLVLASIFFVRTRGMLFSYTIIITMCVGALFLSMRKRKVYLSLILGFLTVSASWFFINSAAGNERIAVLLKFFGGDASAISEDYTMYLRILFWESAIEDFDSLVKVIVGCGFGTYLFLDPWGIGDWQLLPASLIHNQLLSLTYNGGLLIWLFIFLLFSSVYKRVESTFSLNTFLSAMLVYSFFTPVFSDSVYASVFLYFFARFSRVE